MDPHTPEPEVFLDAGLGDMLSCLPCLCWRPISYLHQNLKSFVVLWLSSHRLVPSKNTAARLSPVPLAAPRISDSPAHTFTHPTALQPPAPPSHHLHPRPTVSPGQRLPPAPPPGSRPSPRSAACRFFLQHVSEIWPSLPICTAKTLVKTLSVSHLNYCKILLPAWQRQPQPALPLPSPCPATTSPANRSLKPFMHQRITHKHLLAVIFLPPLAGGLRAVVKTRVRFYRSPLLTAIRTWELG